MVFGSVAAIGQKNLKRLMAYSSISHMGFALAGLAVSDCVQICVNRFQVTEIYIVLFVAD